MKALSEWLSDIQSTHPKDWDLGLDRVGEVAQRLDLNNPASTSFLIAGTNGKGSTCEVLSRLCAAKGLSYGKTTSPFFHRYNEQIVINGVEASDEQIVSAFEAIKHAAVEISLSYFEYGALAAMWLFREAGVEVAILEIGLGGRLDAMNVIEPDVSIITRIALDHQDWLGDTREAIGFEKAGVMRAAKPVVVLDEDAPRSLLDHADSIGAQLVLVDRDFNFDSNSLSIQDMKFKLDPVRLPLPSVVAAIVGFLEAGYTLKQSDVDQALADAALPGRFQTVNDSPLTILDVCHNPDAAGYLKTRLDEISVIKHWHLIVGILQDKDLAEIFHNLSPLNASWYVCDINAERGASALELGQVLHESCGLSSQTYDKVRAALDAARLAADADHGIVVLGSFSTVAEALETFADNVEDS